MTDQQQQTLDDLKKQYDTLNTQLPEVMRADSQFTKDDKNQFVMALNTALGNLLTAQNGILEQDNDTVQHIDDAAQGAQKTLDRMLNDLTGLSSKIGIITSALNTVSTALSIIKPIV